MTATDEVAAEAPTAPVPVVEVAPPLRERLRSVGRRALGITFVAIVVLVVSTILVETPIADIWYSFRQEHLSSGFVTPGAPRAGSPLAVLQMPSRSINLIVVQGDGAGTLRAGPGHRPSSPLPGATGNSIIVGHRDNWGGPFRLLGNIRKNDSLFLERRTRSGDLAPLFFKVISARTVPSGDRTPYANSTDHRLTLVTSAGGGRRLVIQAVSGDVGRLRRPGPSTSAATGGVSGAVGTSLVWFGICLVVAIGIVLVGRRRHAGRVIAIAVTPVAAGALLALILAGDALFRSPLS